MFGTNTFAQVPFSAASGLLLLAAVADTALVQDTFASAATFAPTVVELVVVNDQPAVNFSVFSNVAEAVVAQDVNSASVVFPVSLAEAATASEALSARVDFLASVADTVTALDGFRANAVFPVAVFENLLVLDSLLGRELWEQIDDTQTADWTDVLRPTTIEDISVFGGANFGVLAFAGELRQAYNPNPVVWTQVDDSSDTTWTDIVAV